jgi:hypothetical protein
MKKPHKRCAFCFQANRLTREHIWPEGILKRLPFYTAKFNEKADKVIGGDHIIKDVCVTCNNGALSALDAYGCMLFDKYFHAVAEPKTELQFEYDYDKLFRWLAKIAYTTVRSSSANPNLSFLRPLTPYILGQSVRPSEMELYLDIVTHSTIPTIHGIQQFPATAYRSESVERKPPLPDWRVVRLVSINSFYFYILLFEKHYQESNDLAKVRRWIKGVLVPPESASLALPRSTTGAFDVHKDHLLFNFDKYRKFFRG